MPERTARVVCATPAAARWLRDASPHRIRLLHASRRSVAVERRGRVLVLGLDDAGRVPLGAVVEGEDLGAATGGSATVEAIARGIRIGTLHLETGEPSRWHPRPRWEALGAAFHLAPAAAWCGAATRDGLARPDAAAALAAIASLDTVAARDAARAVAGVGPGLTPAGDDLLAGALLALHASVSPALARRLGRVVARAAAPRTTALSAAWLHGAARGEAAVGWHRLVDALASDDAAAVASARRVIAATGATSGAALLAGFDGVVARLAAPGTAVRGAAVMESPP